MQKAWRIEPVMERGWSSDFDPAIYEDKKPLSGIYGTVHDAMREGRRRMEPDAS